MSTELESKLKQADPEVQNFVTALKSENLKLHKQIAKLQAENVSLNSRITILKNVPQPNISINLGDKP